MSDEPPRLNTTARSAFARQLIASADVDRSDVDAKDRALASLGLGTAFAAGVGTAANAVKAASGPVAGKGAIGSISAALTAKVGATTLLLFVGFAVAGVGVVLAVTEKESAPHVTESSPSMARVPPAPVAAHLEPSGAATSVSPSPSSSEPPVPSSPRRVRTTRAHAATPAPSTSEATRDRSEPLDRLAMLMRVRAALNAHDPARALILLDELERDSMASSAVGEEIAILRIDALYVAGRRAEATSLARAFLERNPTSAYAKRVQEKVHAP